MQNIILRFNRFQQHHPVIGFPLAVIKKYGDDQAGYQAALLTYYGFLSLFPLLLVLTSVMQLVFQGNDQLRQRILTSSTEYIPPALSHQLAGNVGGLSGTGLALAAGILVTLYGARGVADAFRNTMNHVWQVPYAKRPGFPAGQLRSLAMVVVGGIGLLAAPLLAGLATSGGHALAFRVLSLAITLAVLWGVFVFLTRMSIPHLTFRDIWTGSLMTALGLMILQSVGGYIVARELRHMGSLYGAFAIVLGLLFWLYLQSQVILYAAETNSVRVFKLWPRSIEANSMTEQDRHAYRLYAQRTQYQTVEQAKARTPKTSAASSDDSKR